MDYAEALEWLYGRQRIGIKLGLSNIEALVAALQRPHERFQSIHVAGTNGKGSVCHLLAATLHKAGHRTGLFTSPHLVSFCERMRVDGAMISEADVAQGLSILRPIVEAMDADDQRATFFEINTALAFWWFAKQGVEWAVIETGLGGRLDATNILMPAVTVITSIGLDHQGMLGDTIGEIAAEKAGIMKPGIPCVTSATGDALVILKVQSQATRSPMSVVGEDYQVLPRINGFRLAHPGGDAEYDLALAGEHQITNAATVVATVDALRQRGVPIPGASLQQALQTTTLAGRLESCQVRRGDRQLEVLLDGAHNEAGMQALRYHLGRIDWAGFAWIAGFSADKDWGAMVDQCLPLAAHVYGVPLRTRRGLDPQVLGERVSSIGFPFTQCDDVQAALQQAVKDGHQRVLVAGSLFLVGEASACVHGKPLEEVRGDQ